MDMTPPQAPPAVVNSAQQAAIDTVGRLSAVNDWLTEQRDHLPELPHATRDMGKDDYLTALAAYWDAPVTTTPGMAAMSRRTVFASHLAAVMRDEATLRGDDGTLDAADATLAAAFARSQGEVPPPGSRALELTVGGVAYAGALVLQGDTGRALLFMPGRGWEAFASLDELHAHTEERMRTALAGVHELSGLMRGALDLTSPDPLVASRDIAMHPFDALTERLIEVQRQKVTQAWEAFADDDLDEQALVDRLGVIVEPSASLDVYRLLAHRDMRLQGQLDEERLASVPAEVRTTWHDALADWRSALKAVTQLRRHSGMSELVPLQHFALNALAERLSALGIEEDPAGLKVRVTPDPIDPVKRWFHGEQPSETSLLELSLQNVAAIPNESYEIVRQDGSSVSLDSSSIRLLVRSADIGATYLAYLNASFGAATDDGKAYRDLATRLQRARMRFELADARVSTYVSSETPSFRKDHAERGYHWVRAVLDGPDPSNRARVEGHDIVVRQLTYRGATIADVLLFGVRDQGGVFRVVLYTPDAPDGRNFREFDDRAEAARAFLLNPSFETYLLDRLPASFTHRASNGSRHFKRDDALKRANWVLGQGNPPRQIQLDEPIEERNVEGDFLEAVYDTSMHQLTTDVLDMSRATDLADWESTVGMVSDIGSNPLHDVGGKLATDFVLAVPRAFQASWRAYDNIKAGDYGQAFVDVTEAYTSALNLAGVATSQTVRGVGSVVRAGHGVRSLTATRKTLAPPQARFEARFRAQGLSARPTTPSADGVVRMGGKTYVEQGGQLYHVRFDAASNGWRLTRPGALDANISGPAISRSPIGTWQVRNDIGLLGGTPPLPSAMRAIRLSRMRQGSRIDPQSAGMTDDQLARAHSELFRQGGVQYAARVLDQAILQAQASRGVQVMSTADRTAWSNALAVGRGQRAPTPLTAERRLAGWQAVRRASLAPRPVSSMPPAATPPRPAAPQPRANLVGVGNATELAVGDWPAYVWHYMRATDVPTATGTYAVLPQSVQPGTGAQGLAVTGRGPYSPAPVFQGSTATGPAPVMGQRAEAWVRIDLVRLGAPARLGARQPLRVFRVQHWDGSPEYIVRPMPTAFDPTASRPLVFLRGNYEVGRWSTTPH